MHLHYLYVLHQGPVGVKYNWLTSNETERTKGGVSYKNFRWTVGNSGEPQHAAFVFTLRVHKSRWGLHVTSYDVLMDGHGGTSGYNSSSSFLLLQHSLLSYIGCQQNWVKWTFITYSLQYEGTGREVGLATQYTSTQTEPSPSPEELQNTQ